MAYAPHELVDKWRRQGKHLPNLSHQAYARREALRDCADELELYHHENNHDAEWVMRGCPHCDRERAGEG